MFKTPEVTSIYIGIEPAIRKLLFSLNDMAFDKANEALKEMKAKIGAAKDRCDQDSEQVLNELYIINQLTAMLTAYTQAWSKILRREFSSSWNSLQGSINLLRQIKKLSDCSNNLTNYFEDQLLALEMLYPYNVFFSIGAITDWFKCSICGNDIDSFECPHMAGELYQGKMAYAIVQKFTEVNHVAMVKHPEDKRCVVKYDDKGDQFKLILFLSDLITSGKLELLHFGKLEFSKKVIKNPEFRKTGRNNPCFCGSGKKFKKCCVSKEHVETEHVDIVAQAINLNEIFT